MGIFSRRDKSQQPSGQGNAVPDDREVRDLMTKALAARGIRVTDGEGELVAAGVGRFGLSGITVLCLQEPDRGKWPAVVDQHVASLVSASRGPDPFDAPTSSLEPMIYARLYQTAYIEQAAAANPGTAASVVRQDFSPDLSIMLSLDLPDAVATFSGPEVERHGGWDALFRRGVHNLRRLPVEDYRQVEAASGGTVDILSGESVYTGSRAIIVKELIGSLGGTPPGPHGWLLSVPDRSRLAWHAIRDQSALGAAEGLANMAQFYVDSPAPLSPHVFWYDGSNPYRVITKVTERQTLALDPESDFHRVVAGLPAPG